jgi:hypothetical protein
VTRNPNSIDRNGVSGATPQDLFRDGSEGLGEPALAEESNNKLTVCTNVDRWEGGRGVKGGKESDRHAHGPELPKIIGPMTESLVKTKFPNPGDKKNSPSTRGAGVTIAGTVSINSNMVRWNRINRINGGTSALLSGPLPLTQAGGERGVEEYEKLRANTAEEEGAGDREAPGSGKLPGEVN